MGCRNSFKNGSIWLYNDIHYTLVYFFSSSSSPSNFIPQPIGKCRRVFQALHPYAVEELCNVAESLIVPVRMGIARPTAPFTLASTSIDAVQGSEELFSVEPLPPRPSPDQSSRSVGFSALIFPFFISIILLWKVAMGSCCISLFGESFMLMCPSEDEKPFILRSRLLDFDLEKKPKSAKDS